MTTSTNTRAKPRRQAGTGSGRQAGTGSGRQAGAQIAIEPRMRERRIAVARSAGRRRLRLLVWGLSTVLAIALALAVLHSPIVGVRHVRITPSSHLSVATLAASAQINKGEPMVDISTTATQDRIDALAWVARSRVRLQWPSTVVVNVVERIPVAKVPAKAGQWSVVDSTGRVLEVTNAPPAGLVTIAGVDQTVPAGSNLNGSAAPALAVAAALVSDIPASVRTQVLSINEVGGGQVELHLAFGGLAQLGGTDQLAEKLRSLSTVLARVNLVGVTAIDVSVPQAPTVTRQGSHP
ncbi:MAG: cell division protein FtsQ/DivIB [Acidimicrobiales bacterium]